MKQPLILTSGNLHLGPSQPSPNGICIINKETQPRFCLFKGELVESYIRCALYRNKLLLEKGYQNTIIIMFCDN